MSVIKISAAYDTKISNLSKISPLLTTKEKIDGAWFFKTIQIRSSVASF
jgi:hypothetical protein